MSVPFSLKPYWWLYHAAARVRRARLCTREGMICVQAWAIQQCCARVKQRLADDRQLWEKPPQRRVS